MATPVPVTESVVKKSTGLTDVTFTWAVDKLGTGDMALVTGNILVVVCSAVGATIPTLAKSGGVTFDKLLPDDSGADGGVAVGLQVFTRKIDGTEDATAVFTSDVDNATDGFIAKAFQFSGQRASDAFIVGVVGTATGTTAITPPLVAVPENDAYHMSIVAAGHTSVSTWSPFATRQTELLDDSTDPAGNAVSLGIYSVPDRLVGQVRMAFYTASVSSNSLVGVYVYIRSADPLPGPSVAEIGTSGTGNTSAEFNVNPPPGTVSGDTLAGWADVGSAAATSVSITGLTPRATGTADGGVAASAFVGSEAWDGVTTDFPVTSPDNGTTNGMIGKLLRLVGADPVPHKIGSVVAVTAGTTINITGVTTEVDNCLVIYFVFTGSGAVVGWSAGITGLVYLGTQAQSDPGQAASMHAGAFIQAAAGATGTKAFVATASQDSHVGVCVAFKPAADTAARHRMMVGVGR